MQLENSSLLRALSIKMRNHRMPSFLSLKPKLQWIPPSKSFCQLQNYQQRETVKKYLDLPNPTSLAHLIAQGKTNADAKASRELCGKCKEVLRSNFDPPQCLTCFKRFHAKCSFSKKSKVDRFKWQCEECIILTSQLPPVAPPENVQTNQAEFQPPPEFSTTIRDTLDCLPVYIQFIQLQITPSISEKRDE